MILHRYFGSHALDTLKDAKLKTSRISSFNDSFEFLFVSIGRATPEEAQRYVNFKLCDPVLFVRSCPNKPKIRKSKNRCRNKGAAEREMTPSLKGDVIKVWPDIVKKTELPIERRRQIIDQELRAICFSDPSGVTRTEEILLWSHYANRHEGIRMGFEFPVGIKEPFEIREITYEKNRVEVVFSLEGEGAALKALEESASVKSEVWRYEQEFRLFTKTTQCEPKEVKKCDSTTTLEYFLAIQREWVKSVDFGVFCPDSDIQPVVNLLKIDYPNVIPKSRIPQDGIRSRIQAG